MNTILSVVLWQRRVDLSIAYALKLKGTSDVEVRWDIFNLFDTVNYALPENVIGWTDFSKITNTIGGPRVMQFGARLRF